MGNIWGLSQEEVEQLINITFNYKIDNKDPTLIDSTYNNKKDDVRREDVNGGNTDNNGAKIEDSKKNKPQKDDTLKRNTYENDDKYAHEDDMYGQSAVYLPDPELDLGFPEGKQEYDSIPCLEDVIEEYNNAPKVRTYNNNVPAGLRNVLSGGLDFFMAKSS